MELNKSLTLMGFGTWNNLEPGKQLVKSKTNIAFNGISVFKILFWSSVTHFSEIARFEDGYVKKRLNERLFEKVQALEEKRARLFKDEKRIAKLKKGGPQKRKQAELEELQMRKNDGKNKKSLDEEQRSVHESYQILLNEYYARKAYREKGMQVNKHDEKEEETDLRKTAQILITQSWAERCTTELSKL